MKVLQFVLEQSVYVQQGTFCQFSTIQDISKNQIILGYEWCFEVSYIYLY